LYHAGSSVSIITKGLTKLLAVVPVWFSYEDPIISLKWFDATLPEINKLIGDHYKGISNKIDSK
jgi:hypothetical protein